ncbi:universal stress protein [Bryobacter aggregatus]|uniref:universal stress protein n=1 Tax=Bryobacter aggregatus TaxID=360054 RepID=UPI00138E1CE2|nr:universal stress protein [Bryobacter aggregatus]
MIKRVLLPVDFSPRDKAAAHYIEQLHRKIPFETIMLHVVPPPDYESAVLEAGGQIIDEIASTRLRLGREKLNTTALEELDDLPVERVILEGFPSERIVSYAAERQVDWIVLPTHGYGPFRRFLLGSVTSKVLNESLCPVFTGAHMEKPKLEDIPFDTVAAAVDLSSSSPRVIAQAQELATALRAKLVVIHAVTGLTSHVGGSFEAAHELHFEAAIQQRLNELTRDLPGVETMVETGDPGKTVASLARRAKADVVVIGRSTSSGFAALRTQTLAIIRESGVPILSV